MRMPQFSLIMIIFILTSIFDASLGLAVPLKNFQAFLSLGRFLLTLNLYTNFEKGGLTGPQCLAGVAGKEGVTIFRSVVIFT